MRVAARRPWITAAVVTLGALAGACGGGSTNDGSDGAPPGDASAACACPGGAPMVAGRLRGTDLEELSGLAASRAHPGLIYGHADSGDRARVFVLDGTGNQVAELSVTGAAAVDWEDLAVTPCGAASCVIVADTGDNSRERDEVVLYRFVEPTAAPRGAGSVAAEALRVRYPGGARDVEAIAADGDTVLLISKEMSQAATAFAVTWPSTPTTTPVTATAIGTMDLIVITGADLFRGPCGARLLVRTYLAVWLFEGPEDATLADLLAAPRRTLVTPAEDQGEAIAWNVSGDAYWTASEGAQQDLHVARCQDP